MAAPLRPEAERRRPQEVQHEEPDSPHRHHRPDAEEAAQFYEKAFGFTRAGRARRGIYMTDGVINVALLTKEHENEKLGLYHFGVWVDDLDDAEKHVVDAGGTYLAGRPTSPNSFYEAKYRDPNGVVFDLTHNGWAGAAKDVVAKP